MASAREQLAVAGARRVAPGRLAEAEEELAPSSTEGRRPQRRSSEWAGPASDWLG